MTDNPKPSQREALLYRVITRLTADGLTVHVAEWFGSVGEKNYYVHLLNSTSTVTVGKNKINKFHNPEYSQDAICVYSWCTKDNVETNKTIQLEKVKTYAQEIALASASLLKHTVA